MKKFLFLLIVITLLLSNFGAKAQECMPPQHLTSVVSYSQAMGSPVYLTKCDVSWHQPTIGEGSQIIGYTIKVKGDGAPIITDIGIPLPATQNKYHYKSKRIQNSLQQIELTTQCLIKGNVEESRANILNMHIANGGIATTIINGRHISIGCTDPYTPILSYADFRGKIGTQMSMLHTISPSARPIVLTFIDEDNTNNNRQIIFANWAEYDSAMSNQNSTLSLLIANWKPFIFDGNITATIVYP